MSISVATPPSKSAPLGLSTDDDGNVEDVEMEVSGQSDADQTSSEDEQNSSENESDDDENTDLGEEDHNNAVDDEDDESKSKHGNVKVDNSSAEGGAFSFGSSLLRDMLEVEKTLAKCFFPSKVMDHDAIPFRIFARVIELRRLQAGMQSAEQDRRVKLASETKEHDETSVLVAPLFEHFDMLLRPLLSLSPSNADPQQVETALVCLGTFCRTFSQLYAPIRKKTITAVISRIHLLLQHPDLFPSSRLENVFQTFVRGCNTEQLKVVASVLLESLNSSALSGSGTSARQMLAIVLRSLSGKKKAMAFAEWIPRILSALLAAIDRESNALRVSAFIQSAALCAQVLSSKLLLLDVSHLRLMLLLFEAIPARLAVTEDVVVPLYAVAHAMAKHRFSVIQHLFAPYLAVVRKLSEIPFCDELDPSARLTMAQNISRLFEELTKHPNAIRHYCATLLADAITLQQTHSFSSGLRDRLLPGLFALLDVCRDQDLQLVHRMLAQTPHGSVYFRSLHQEYSAQKFTGQV
mmetsp:Transcript_56/g.178  ORF Transcript_56/g.178 Transcript_56/m.178 type:complete len:522 (-) Transcript_56:35-1600(-)